VFGRPFSLGPSAIFGGDGPNKEDKGRLLVHLSIDFPFR
jgi:hypothetical protein